MSELLTELEKLEKSTLEDLEKIQDWRQLEELKIKVLGRKGTLAAILRALIEQPLELRPQIGQKANHLKSHLEQVFAKRGQELASDRRLISPEGKIFDYTLPGRSFWKGSLHPLTQVQSEIIEIFSKLGFETVEGPEVETDYYNFEALNMPKNHPARTMFDTFYITENILPRTHTSPVQVRVFEKRKPPVKILAPGRVYRHEAINVRSYCVFNQVEGFYVDKNVTMADLKGVLSSFVWKFFGPEVKLRFRPSFFPFTEPSAEVDISCVLCQQKGCALCKFEGWLEILGAGMIDPEVFKFVGYDSEKYTGYAFGLGVDRIAMLKYKIDDIRLFYENDMRFLRQF